MGFADFFFVRKEMHSTPLLDLKDTHSSVLVFIRKLHRAPWKLDFYISVKWCSFKDMCLYPGRGAVIVEPYSSSSAQ